MKSLDFIPSHVFSSRFAPKFKPHLIPIPQFRLSLLENPTFFHLGCWILGTRSLLSRVWMRFCGSQADGFRGSKREIDRAMFVGQTNTLLRRMQSEMGNDRPSTDSFFSLDKKLKDLCYAGSSREAVRLLAGSGFRVEWRTCSLLLQECIHRKEYELGRRLHAQMIVIGFALNEYLKTKLLTLYAKAGLLVTAGAMFNKLSIKSLISWNAMIAGYVQNGFEVVALTLYCQMRDNGLIPDQFTFASVFRACSASALLEKGIQAHGVMVKCNIGSNVVVHSALMDMYFKCSCPFDGHRVFIKLLDRNVITWSALISGYGHNGKVKEVFELFHAMMDEGFNPNTITFLAVLSACSHAGLVNEGWKYFSSMESVYGIQPKAKHYAVMVDLLGRAGRLHEAYEFVMTSPCKNHPAVWGSLLGACRIHGNVDLMQRSAKKFLELEPNNAGKFVVLSNCYATHGLWKNVAEIRGLMRGSSMRKDPGHSRIEIQNEVHVFFMKDSAHREAEKTYEVLMELMCCIADANCALETSIE